LHPVIKVQQLELKDVLGHPCLCIGVITGAQCITVDTLEIAWIQVFADDHQQNLLVAVRIYANDKSDALLIDLPAFQLMGCQQVVGLETPTEASSSMLNTSFFVYASTTARMSGSAVPTTSMSSASLSPKQRNDLIPCQFLNFSS
jgi:hypothetical protein